MGSLRQTWYKDTWCPVPNDLTVSSSWDRSSSHPSLFLLLEKKRSLHRPSHCCVGKESLWACILLCREGVFMGLHAAMWGRSLHRPEPPKVWQLLCGEGASWALHLCPWDRIPIQIARCTPKRHGRQDCVLLHAPLSPQNEVWHLLCVLLENISLNLL